MMMKILDKFLGRALLDTAFLISLENGEAESLIKGYEFCDEVKSALQSIRANSFMEFANQAYSIVYQHDSNDPDIPFSWPTEGLLKQGEGRGHHIAA
ncbi:MAG: hypothetical protein KAR65_05315 [Anaerolineales bacterium]|nr:hypothetical protein [Anaerolineales bacterium]MCK5634714.1 hypothetical protein [Anaerolineales bacterium]